MGYKHGGGADPYGNEEKSGMVPPDDEWLESTHSLSREIENCECAEDAVVSEVEEMKADKGRILGQIDQNDIMQ